MNLAKKSKIITIIFLSLLQLISKSTSTPTYLYNFCSNTTEFAKNSKYHTNLNTLFKSLSSNSSTNPTGFDITSAGTNTSDAVYGLYLCRGDQNSNACSDCVKTATTIDLPKTYCPNRKVAVIWYDECIVRYSNESLRGKMAQSPKVFLTNTQKMNGNQTSFSDILGDTMNSLATQASNSKSGKKYGTKVAKLSSLNNIYAMEQCTPDLSPTDCYQCLTIANGNLDLKMGARVLQPSCFVRYETYPFYVGATNFSSSPPLPSPGKATSITIMNNCAYKVWPGISTPDGSGNVPTGFSLLKGKSKIINIDSNWVGSIWGRTRCSGDDHSGNFSCETGDCGTGKIECLDTPLTKPLTVADFSFGQNQYMYDISVEAGYNLPMMVAPDGETRDRCNVTGCVFNLSDSACPSSLKVFNTDKSTTIGCRNPCFRPSQCCQSSATSALCQSSDYLPSSKLYGKSCPRAINNPTETSDTKFICHSHKTSYKVTFCPSHNMARYELDFFPPT